MNSQPLISTCSSTSLRWYANLKVYMQQVHLYMYILYPACVSCAYHVGPHACTCTCMYVHVHEVSVTMWDS